MKKRVWVLIAIIIVIGICCSGFFEREMNNIANSVNGYVFDSDNFVVVTEIDTHGGFHGDGTYCLVLDCSDNREKALKNIKGWKKLPLPKELELVAFGGVYYGTTYSGMFPDEAEIPQITNGYYYFEDRHRESTYKDNPTDLFDRHSYNFDFAIYDTDTDMLYCLKIDT